LAGVRRAAKALTAQFVRTISKPGKYFDGHGLILRVQSNGSRRWVQRVMIRGKRTELGLGSAELVPLAQAREFALHNHRLARAGGDPLQAKREAQAVPTFEEAARKVHDLHKPSWTNEKHARDFVSSLEAYVFPELGRRKVSEILPADVSAVLVPIWLKVPETARRVRQRIGTVMEWAIAQGWRQDNPAQHISKRLPRQDRTKNHRKALPYREVADCIATVKASGASPATKLALEFLILTAARSGEVRLARWEEIEVDGADGPAWMIPATRTKMRRLHQVPLSSRARHILKEADALQDGSGLIFPSARSKPLSDMTLSKLVKELGFNADVHGFRTSFRTWVQEKTKYRREVAEAALAHATGPVEAAYARSDCFDERAKMMRDWAQYLAASRNRTASPQKLKARPATPKVRAVRR
jgi:integrase